jgi:hypothetical protein
MFPVGGKSDRGMMIMKADLREVNAETLLVQSMIELFGHGLGDS